MNECGVSSFGRRIEKLKRDLNSFDELLHKKKLISWVNNEDAEYIAERLTWMQNRMDQLACKGRFIEKRPSRRKYHVRNKANGLWRMERPGCYSEFRDDAHAFKKNETNHFDPSLFLITVVD